METSDLSTIAKDTLTLAAWVHKLPSNNVASAGRDLLKMLAAIRSAGLEPEVQLDQADLAAIGLQPILQALCLAIEEGAHPSQSRAAVLAPIVEGLCLALIDIYRDLFSDEEPAGLLQRKSGGQLRATSGHRILHYGLALLRIQRTLNREAPRGLWRDIHAVYEKVANNAALRKKEIYHQHIQDYTPSDLENIYKQCLLAQSLNPTSLGKGYWGEVSETLAYWASLVDLRPCRGSMPNRELYRYVVPGFDSGPIPYSHGLLEQAGAMWIDTSRLDEKIVELFRQMLEDKSDRVTLSTGSQVTMNTLGAFKACWVLEGEGGDEADETQSLTDNLDGLEWLDSLSLNDVRESSRQIHQHLRYMNARRIPLARRYQILCRLIEPAEVVFTNLSKRYGDIFFPLSDRVLRISKVMDDIAQMLAEGWQLVLEDWQATGWLFKNTHPAMQRIAVYRIFHYSKVLITNQLLLKQPQREGIWLRLHRMNLNACKEGWGQQALQKLPEKGDSAPSLTHIYRGILLLSLINMQGLRKDQIREIVESLDYWSDLISTTSRQEALGDSNYPFFVATSKDLPPANTPHICDEGDDDCLMLDVAELQRQLLALIKSSIEQKSDRISLPMNDARQISLATLRYLAATWQQTAQRKGDRRLTNIDYQALFSIASSHYVLREGEAEPTVRKEEQVVVESTQQGEEFNPDVVQHGHDDLVVREDVWETIMPNTELPEEEAWSPEADYSRYRYATISIHDYSTGGCRFSFTPREDQRVRIGDIISLRKGEGKDVLCGYVRWASHSGEDELMIGLQFLVHRLEPVWLLSDTKDGQEARLPALLGDGVHNEKATLLLPPIPGVRKRKLRLLFAEKTFGIYLAGLPEQQSSSFEAFRFGVVNLESRKRLASEKQVSTKVLKQLDPQAGAAQHKADVKEASVWDMI